MNYSKKQSKRIALIIPEKRIEIAGVEMQIATADTHKKISQATLQWNMEALQGNVFPWRHLTILLKIVLENVGV
jgi:hypothetical protein